ncbi:MAG: efflux RND transporter permease subunit [Phycisphaerales bacterium JB059]
MGLPEFGVRRPVVANLVMFAVIGAGLIFGLTLRREFFPEIEPTQVVIGAPYPGAAPEEVEDSLATKIEDRVADLTGVTEVTSTISEGGASVRVEFEDGFDIDEAVADVKREMDALQDLPEESERITVVKLEPNLPAIVLSLYGDASERDMKEAIQQIGDDLRTIPGMGDVVLSGVRTDEISVEVRPEVVMEHRLSLPMVSDAISAAMRELPGGSVRSETANVAVRSVGVEEQAAKIREIVVKGDPSGQVLRLGDIAEISEGFADVSLSSRLNGKPAVSLTVFKVGDKDVVEIAELVKAYAAGRRNDPMPLSTGEKLATIFRKPGDTSPVSPRIEAYELGRSRAAQGPPPGELIVTTDLARFVQQRLNLLSRNAFWGGVLVFITLVLLLNWRVSFWVAIGLVISLLGTLAVMSWLGVTLNLLTMFGLIVVIGILVDDAIVVAENITARHERGEPALEAAIRGANQVAWPVVATVLTTICAFLPLALIGGQIGDFMKWLPIVAGCALAVSLIESLFILPCHMAHSLKSLDKQKEMGGSNRLQAIELHFDAARDRVFNKWLIPRYVRLLDWCLTYRYFAAAVGVALVLLSVGMVAGGRLKFIYFETEDSETINIALTMPIGTPASETDAMVRRLEAAALAQPEVDSVYAVTGGVGDINGEGNDAVADHLGQLILELHPVEERDRTSEQVELAIREQAGELTGIKSLRMEGVGAGPGGPALTFTVTGENQRAIDQAVRMLQDRMATYDGVFDIATDADSGQRELRFTLRDGASEMGFTRAGLGRQIQGAVFGIEAFTFAGEREDVDVRVKAPPSVRKNLAALESMHVLSPAGQPVPLGEVAHIEEGLSYATIRRLDRKRAVTVSAEVDRGAGTPEELASAMQGDLRESEAAVPGVRILERGRQKEVAESFATLPLGMLTAMGLIYVVLAWLFQSYVQPLIVMSAIPFAMIGMIWGHLLLGFSMTFLSLVGFVALAGVVDNDSLIYMEFFNAQRRAGATVRVAALEAGRARVRAILLTTITTVLGLLPLMLEQSFQARFLIPMAITIAFGLISATGIILIVLPCFLMMFADIKHKLVVLWSGRLDSAHEGYHPPARALRSPTDD